MFLENGQVCQMRLACRDVNLAMASPFSGMDQSRRSVGRGHTPAKTEVPSQSIASRLLPDHSASQPLGSNQSKNLSSSSSIPAPSCIHDRVALPSFPLRQMAPDSYPSALSPETRP